MSRKEVWGLIAGPRWRGTKEQGGSGAGTTRTNRKGRDRNLSRQFLLGQSLHPRGKKVSANSRNGRKMKYTKKKKGSVRGERG